MTGSISMEYPIEFPLELDCEPFRQGAIDGIGVAVTGKYPVILNEVR